MDDVEAIKQLKARYFRCLDTKDWDGLRSVFADDLVMDTTDSGGEVLVGADDIIAFLREALAEALTVHHGHMPEIELLSSSSATGIWAMDDRLRWPDGTELHGFGHYHERYLKLDGRWLLAELRLTRLRMDVSEPD